MLWQTTHPLKTKTINGRNKLIKAKHVSVDSTNEQKEHAGITGRSLLEVYHVSWYLILTF